MLVKTLQVLLSLLQNWTAIHLSNSLFRTNQAF